MGSMDNDGPVGGRPDRRTLLKRGAVVGGGLVWATPVVQTIASPAFATGTQQCVAEVKATFWYWDCRETYHQHQNKDDHHGCRTYKKTWKQGCKIFKFTASNACCECLEQCPHLSRPLAVIWCMFVKGKCELTSIEYC